MPQLLSVSALDNVKNYKYHGVDTSYLYIYVLSPFAQWCVDTFVPMWMAPNLITLLGLMSTVVSATCTLLFNPTLSASGPRWLAALTGTCIFFYQTMDNMDGKQARRTGSSTALGLLFDHGCDAINAGLCVIPMSAAMGTGWTLGVFFPLWCGMVPFYFETWEEYHVGSMVLPFFNGPSDGLFIAVVMCFVTFFVGAEIWHTPCLSPATVLAMTGAHPDAPEPSLTTDSPFDQILGAVSLRHVVAAIAGDVTPFHGAIAFVVIVAGATSLVSVVKVLAAADANKRPYLPPLLELLPFVVFFGSSFWYCRTSAIALAVHPWWTLLFIGATNVEVVSHVMLMHVSGGAIRPFARPTAWLAPLLPLHVHFSAAGGSESGASATVHALVTHVTEAQLLRVLALLSAALTATRLHLMCTEIAAHLGIPVFRLADQKQQKKHT